MSTEKPLSDALSLDDDYFIKNAISCWLHHFPNHKWTPIYKDMRDRIYQRTLEDSSDQLLPKPVRRKTK